MIKFNTFGLSNGLQVLVHEDPEVHTAVVNVLYQVGSRDENEAKTGFAHLFEHLMFGGSKNISSYDEELQKAGGDNNAFTTPDVTNYYLTVPANNLETGFWLESDRMLSLSFDPTVLEVQRKVVIEEFKQRYLNQPYGDAWLKLRPLAYKVHPYKWATIGKDISHIEGATLDDVQDFFSRYYVPNNAILVVAGNVKTQDVETLAKKWFGPIPAGPHIQRSISKEPIQNEFRLQEVEADVPLNSIYMTFHMSERMSETYYSTDLLSDILGQGKSSRLHEKLVKQKQIFNSINAYITGSVDPGLMVITGKLNRDRGIDEGEAAIWDVLNQFIAQGPRDTETSKVKNQSETSLVYSQVEVLNRAVNLAFAASLGNPNLVNVEAELINSVSSEMILNTARRVLKKSNCSTLRYKTENGRKHEDGNGKKLY